MAGNTILSVEGSEEDYSTNRMRPKASNNKNSLESQYTGMKGKRETFLSRAKMMAKLTLPALFNDSENTTDQGQGYTQNGWQSLGAQGHNHLANKLVMTWFPPQRSFFRLSFTDEAKKALFDEGIKDTDLLQMLSSAEQRCRLYHEQVQGQLAWTEAAKHLIASGNAMLYLPPDDDGLVCYPMDRYVIKRSKSGRVLKMILEEEKALSEFDESTRTIIKVKRPGTKPTDDVKIYTCYKWDGKDRKYIITQEVVEVIVGQEYRVTEESSPFIILVWSRLYGEDYGRGLLETISGDLFVYGFLSKAVAKGAALMSEIKFLIRRGSATSPQEHAAAESGDYLWGDKEDVHVVQLEKYADYQSIAQVMSIYEKRIGQAFLLQSAIRRDAERVTTVEIRQDAMELETALGGVYSQIANQGQLPYARILLARTKFTIGASDVKPIVVTGIESLGKAGELDKLAQFSEMMTIPNGWSPAAQERIKWSDYMTMIAANLNMDTPWLMTEQDYLAMKQQQESQQQQQALLESAGKAAPQLLKE